MFTIYKLNFMLKSNEDIPLPSITSRIVKQIIIEAIENCNNENLKSIVEFFKVGSEKSKFPVKPVKVTFLYKIENGVRKYLWCEYETRPIIKAGCKYYFDFILVESNQVFKRTGVEFNALNVIDILDSISGEFKIFQFNKVEVESKDLSIVTFDDFEFNEFYDTVLIKFETPVLLQYPKHPKLKNVPSRHTLYPQPMLVILSLINKWNNLVDKEYITLSHAIYAPYEIIEVNHEIKPVTIQFRKIRERGFIGWIKYGIDSKSEKRWRNYLRLFKFAEYLGIGRSTSIGLGQVSINFSKRS